MHTTELSDSTMMGKWMRTIVNERTCPFCKAKDYHVHYAPPFLHVGGFMAYDGSCSECLATWRVHYTPDMLARTLVTS